MQGIKKGKDCVALVERVLADVTAGRLDGIEEKLEDIKRTGNELAEQSEQRASEIEKVEEEYKQRTAETHRETGELGCQLEERKNRECDLETNLSGKQDKLAEEQRTLFVAERELREAERKLGDAKRKARRQEKEGELLGAVGIKFSVTPRIGPNVGAAAGASAAGLFSGDVDAARRKVDRCKGQVQRAESDISFTRKELSGIEAKITSLLQQCGNLEEQKLQYNDETRKMKEAVLFFRRAAMYWKEFKQISEHGADRTALIQKVICKAKEKEDLSWLLSDTTREIRLTFLEAWEVVEAKYAEGSEFVFHIEQ